MSILIRFVSMLSVYDSFKWDGQFIDHNFLLLFIYDNNFWFQCCQIHWGRQRSTIGGLETWQVTEYFEFRFINRVYNVIKNVVMSPGESMLLQSYLAAIQAVECALTILRKMIFIWYILPHSFKLSLVGKVFVKLCNRNFIVPLGKLYTTLCQFESNFSCSANFK